MSVHPRTESFAVAVLGRLRDAGYRPRGWRAFFADSFARTAHDLERFPRATASLLRMGILGAVAVGAASILAGASAWASAAGFGLWLVIVIGARWHVGMLDRNRLGLANVLTLSRALAVALLIVASSHSAYLVVVSIGAATDVADGRIARQEGPTRFGEHADRLVDALFYPSAALIAASAGWLPVVAAALLAARFAAVAIGATVAYFVLAGPPPAGVWLSARYPTALASVGVIAAGASRAARPAGVAVVTGASVALGSVAVSARRMWRALAARGAAAAAR